ncbi:MAG: pyridoxal phosphate-dependent aminotransferase [Bacteroidales bacterium]|nr:pyridoxal phosphate-dependent aminotransferase [Bacteroidales bacterium]
MENKIFDFDHVPDRRGTNSYKWDLPEIKDAIPMWVADMDFKTAPCIIEALKKRVEHGVFGYTFVPDSYYEATVNWFSRRHGLSLKPEWILYTSGVIPALSAVIKALTKPGDKVIVQTPVYNHFFSSIRNNECIVTENPLIQRNGSYEMDFEDLEEKASDPDVKLLLLCNPHNPAGRVWSSSELKKLGDICARNNVIVVSDEIHNEIVFPPYKYVPYGAVSDDFRANSVTCCSPTKSFNIAGLQIANIFCENAEMREAINKALNVNEVCDVNPFGVIALIEAYTNGEGWLNELIEYIYKNYRYVRETFESQLPEMPVMRLEGTYLAWVDCSVLEMPSTEIMSEILEHAKVKVNDSEMYGAPNGEFIRLNLAAPFELIKEGTDRIIATLKYLLNKRLD